MEGLQPVTKSLSAELTSNQQTQTRTDEEKKATPETAGQEKVAPETSGGEKVAPQTSGQEDVSERVRRARSISPEGKGVRRRVSLTSDISHIKDFRSPEVIRQLSGDPELADATVSAYVSYFNFASMPINVALRFFLRVLWPDDELKLQHLFIRYFSLWYLKCNRRPPYLQRGVYNLCWAVIILNADLHGGQKRTRKISCQDFVRNLNGMCEHFDYSVDLLKQIYKSIQINPLCAYRVKSRRRGVEEKPNTRVYKSGHLLCKRVTEENGRRTRMCKRSWKPFSAVLKGMVLQLDSEQVKCQITIRLHHALAYPLRHKNMPDVLYLKTADCRVFYFRAESEVEQRLWIAAINLIAARFSAPPLSSSSNTKTPIPRVLPSFPSPLSLEQQLEYTKSQLHKVSEYMSFYQAVPLRKGTPPSDYLQQEVRRYTTYVRALEKPARETHSNVHEFLGQNARTPFHLGPSFEKEKNTSK